MKYLQCEDERRGLKSEWRHKNGILKAEFWYPFFSCMLSSQLKGKWSRFSNKIRRNHTFRTSQHLKAGLNWERADIWALVLCHKFMTGRGALLVRSLLFWKEDQRLPECTTKAGTEGALKMSNTMRNIYIFFLDHISENLFQKYLQRSKWLIVSSNSKHG